MSTISIQKRLADTTCFPDVCIACAEHPATQNRLHNFTWVPSWCYLLFFTGLLPLLIVYFLVQKRQSVYLRLCPNCHSKFKWLQPLTLLVGMFALIAFVASLVALCEQSNGLFGLLMSATFAVPIAFHILYYKKWNVQCIEINDWYVILNLPNENYPYLYDQHLDRTMTPICSQCHERVVRGAAFCQLCGGTVVVPQPRRLTNTWASLPGRACPRCYCVAPPYDHFCSRCGMTLGPN